MKHPLSIHIHSETLHHAYCLHGAHDLGSFFTFLEESLGVATRGNPDFWHGQFESLGIDEARQIKEMQQRSAANVGAKKVFVISTDTITHEAQNALLKVFEEPTADTHFFLLMPSAEMLLPTLRSRVVMVPAGPAGSARQVGDDSAILATSGTSVARLAEQFLAASKGKRMALLKPLMEEKDKRAAIAFVDHVLKIRSKSAQDTKVHRKDLEELLAMRSYLNDRSASVKMILECLTLSLG